MVADQSAVSRRSVGERLAIGRRLVGDFISGVRFWLQKVCNSLEIGRQPIGNWSAISRRLKTVSGLSATAATGRRSVANLSPTSRQPISDHQKPFYNRFGRREVSLAATKISLRPNRPCNLLQQVGDQSPTSLQPPCNLPATTRNFGRKEVAGRLQAMCDRGFTSHMPPSYDPCEFFFFGLLNLCSLFSYFVCSVTLKKPTVVFWIKTRPFKIASFTALLSVLQEDFLLISQRGAQNWLMKTQCPNLLFNPSARLQA